jgi:hypothetical protein
LLASATTEGALGAIVDADIIGTTQGFAAIGTSAGLAQIGVVGDADKDQVGVTGTNLLTRPSLGTFFRAGLGAYALPHMLDAPPRLAVAVIATLVHETAITWLAIDKRQVWFSFG